MSKMRVRRIIIFTVLAVFVLNLNILSLPFLQTTKDNNSSYRKPFNIALNIGTSAFANPEQQKQHQEVQQQAQQEQKTQQKEEQKDQKISKKDKYIKYNNLELKEISTKENKEKGLHIFYTEDVLKLSENITPESFSYFANQFKPFKKDGAILKFIDINSINSNNLKGSPFIKYFKVENTKSGYIREDLYICTNHTKAINYTLSNNTKGKWKKEELKRDCMEE